MVRQVPIPRSRKSKGKERFAGRVGESGFILNVYQKNTRAISFYQREGFEIQYSGLDEATGEKDYVMAWQQK